MNNELNIGTINGLTVENILDKMVEKGIGISGGGTTASDIVEGVIGVGRIVIMDEIRWRVVHVDDSAKECVLAKEYFEAFTAFDSEGSASYDGSDLMTKCDTFLHYLSYETRNALVTKTVHGVEGKIWVPQSNWISTSQPYGSPPAGSWTGSNVFQYFTDNNSRIYKNEGGTALTWWTASPSGSSIVWAVNTDGSLGSSTNPVSSAVGFRPFCCLKI